MAEQTTESQASVSNNGQHPPLDDEPWSIRDQVVNAMTPRELVTTVLTQLSLSPYNAHLLYRSVFQHRFAEIRRDDAPLYFGELLQGVSISIRERAAAWDRDIATLAQAQDELDIVPLSLVEPEDITWLWYPYIPLRKLTLIEGDPASGKTYLILAIAAGITKGYDLPDQTGHIGTPTDERKGTVLYVSAEDGMADTIRPRAEKCGADLSRLFVLREPQPISLQEPQILKNALARFRPKLLVLDPIQAFLGGRLDMHRANEVRPLMTTLLGMAINYECAIICVRHWTKAIGGKASNRGQGNVDFGAAARSQISVGESPHDAGMRIMAQAKMSLAGLGTSIVFSIADEGLEWAGTSTITANELSQAQPNLQRHQRKDAMKWLKEFLTPTAQPAELVIHEAEKVAISEKTLRRAKEALGVLSTRMDSVWYWRLPTMQKWERERYPGQEDQP
jgi:hypothetical protein